MDITPDLNAQSTIDSSATDTTRHQLPLSSQPDFIPLPPDPSVKLTKEQLEALMGGAENRANALLALREIVALGKRRALAAADGEVAHDE